MGVKLMPLPEEPFIRFAGRLSDQERLQALEAATVVVVPSPYESLSLLALESFAVGTPILANARSEVLVDHCHRSNAGLFYADRDEFTECLKLLVADHRLRAAMGRNGRQYVRQNYRWDVILASDVRGAQQVRAMFLSRRTRRLQPEAARHSRSLFRRILTACWRRRRASRGGTGVGRESIGTMLRSAVRRPTFVAQQVSPSKRRSSPRPSSRDAREARRSDRSVTAKGVLKDSRSPEPDDSSSVIVVVQRLVLVPPPSLAAAASASPGPLARRRRGRMSWRLIISFSVVGLMCSSSAARFWTPPAASSVDSIRRFSKSVMTSLNEMPSGGIATCGIWNGGCCGRAPAPGRRRCASPTHSTAARSITFSSSRTLPGQSYSISRSSASGVSSRFGLRFSSPYFSRKCCTSSGMSSLRSRSAGSCTVMTCSR